MKLIALRFSTGTKFCSHNEYGEYDKIAYVWENGTIDWKVDITKYTMEQLLPVYKCSATYTNVVNEKKSLLKRLQAEYPTIISALKRENVSRYIMRLQEDIYNLDRFKTTMVIN